MKLQDSAKQLIRFQTAIMLMIVLSSASFVSCASKRQMTQTEQVSETTKDKAVKSDEKTTIYLRDSIIVKLNTDTVFVEKYRDRWHKITKYDTIITQDTIYLNRVETVIKEVNRLHWYQEALMWLGAVLGCALIIVIIIKIK